MIQKLLWFYIGTLLFLLACQETQQNAVDNTTDSSQKEVRTPGNKTQKTILFFGNSLTAGYGLDNPEKSFPALIQQKINENHLHYQVVNAGLSGETTAEGLQRIDWILKKPLDIFVLELGGNDGLRGISPNHTFDNLQGIMKKVKGKYAHVKILLTGIEAPPNMGEEYTTAFRNIFKKLAAENKVYFLPFILDKVGGVTTLTQSDGIHPNEEGHQILAENVWKVLKGML